MTKKDYNMAAEIIFKKRTALAKIMPNLSKEDCVLQANRIEGGMVAFIQLFKADNPAFNESIFFDACHGKNK